MGNWVKEWEERYRTAQCKRQLHTDLQRAPRSGPLTAVITETGECVDRPERVKAALASAFAKRFGTGRQKWYIGAAI